MKAAEARRFVTAYQETASDGDAAEHLCVPTSRFRAWRVAFGLPDKDRFRPERVPAIAFWVAYEDHASDAAAATELDVPEPRFRAWRDGAGLPEKGGVSTPVPARRRRARIPDAAWQEAYDVTATDAEIADAVGGTPGAAAAWRQRQGLPGAHRRSLACVADADQTAWVTAWQETASDQEAAQRLGVRPGHFLRWRRAWGLQAPYATAAR